MLTHRDGGDHVERTGDARALVRAARERMQLEQLRMRVVKYGYLIEDDQLQELLAEAHSLDLEMLAVMRQTIAEALAWEEVSQAA
jgi:hypothetical protein